ncbi:MAG: hypothetical protein U9N61_02820 [Euryarchaeota archaeon]|nr:hypothetical protein [Euryarchaeota archaeon]
MISLKGPLNSGNAAGEDGSATNNTDTTQPVVGKVLAVYLRYNDSPPAGTTDVIIATAGTDIPGAQTILSLPNAASDGWFYPREPVEDNAGSDVTFDGTNEIYAPYAIHDKVNVKIAQANSGDSVDAWLILEL